jgi:hypothetical protein
MKYIDQKTIKYTNIFHYKTLQNLPKFGFLVCKFAIWQPWSLVTLAEMEFRQISTWLASTLASFSTMKRSSRLKARMVEVPERVSPKCE